MLKAVAQMYQMSALHLDGSHFSAGTPLIFLVPWVVAKYLYENQE